MCKTYKVMSAFLASLILIACSANPKLPSPPASDDQVESQELYTNMTTYGEYVGCLGAQQNTNIPENVVKPASKLPGTQEEYLKGWHEGFNKCRIGLGPVIPPGGSYP